jgi:hypothetical protein
MKETIPVRGSISTKGINWPAASVIVAALLGAATLGYQMQKDSEHKRGEAARAFTEAESRRVANFQARLRSCAKFTMLGKQYWKHAVLFAQSLPVGPLQKEVKVDDLGANYAQKALENIEEYERFIQASRPVMSEEDHSAFKSYYDSMYPTSRDIEGALRGREISVLKLREMDRTGRHQKGLSFTSELEKHCHIGR